MACAVVLVMPSTKQSFRAVTAGMEDRSNRQHTPSPQQLHRAECPIGLEYNLASGENDGGLPFETQAGRKIVDFVKL